MYIFDKDVVKKKKLKFSNRGELEITDLIKMYKKDKNLEYDILGRGYTWFDVGNFDNLLSASLFVKAIEERQGFKIGCIEEIAYNNKWINKKQFIKIIESTKESQYSQYLKKLFDKKLDILDTQISGLILFKYKNILTIEVFFMNFIIKNLNNYLKKNFVQITYLFQKNVIRGLH